MKKKNLEKVLFGVISFASGAIIGGTLMALTGEKAFKGPQDIVENGVLYCGAVTLLLKHSSQIPVLKELWKEKPFKCQTWSKALIGATSSYTGIIAGQITAAYLLGK